MSQIQSIADESRGSIRRKIYSIPQPVAQDSYSLLPNDKPLKEVVQALSILLSSFSLVEELKCQSFPFPFLILIIFLTSVFVAYRENRRCVTNSTLVLLKKKSLFKDQLLQTRLGNAQNKAKSCILRISTIIKLLHPHITLCSKHPQIFNSR